MTFPVFRSRPITMTPNHAFTSFNACNHSHFSNFMSTVNVIMLLTRMGKFMYMQAWLTNSIMICMLALHVTTLNHCHIVAMGMTLFQLPKSLILEVLSIKHCRQSTFAETPSTTRHSRDARRRRASMLVTYNSVIQTSWFLNTLIRQVSKHGTVGSS